MLLKKVLFYFAKQTLESVITRHAAPHAALSLLFFFSEKLFEADESVVREKEREFQTHRER